MLKYICLYTKASEYQAHTTWGGGYVQPHVQLRTDINEIDFNQIIADDKSNKPLMDIARAQNWSIGGGANTTYLTKNDVERRPSIGRALVNNQTLIEFSEWRFFTGVTTTAGNQNNFSGATNLKILIPPPTLKSIGGFTFHSTRSLEFFNVPQPNISTYSVQSFASTRLYRWNSEYNNTWEDKNNGSDEQNSWGGPNLKNVIFNGSRTVFNGDYLRAFAGTINFIWNHDATPVINGINFFAPTVNATVYYPKDVDISSIKSHLTGFTRRGKYVPCDRDKFGNLVLPFRLKKWWEPDVT